jgi:hypothetical protein
MPVQGVRQELSETNYITANFLRLKFSLFHIQSKKPEVKFEELRILR